MRTALITGVAGQDGIYLARLLLADGCRVVGTVPSGAESSARTAAYLEGVHVVPCDVRDVPGMARLVASCDPDEVYNLAALSSVGRSWSEPDRAAATNGTAVADLLQVLVDHRDRTGRDVRFFQASSAEVHSDAAGSPYALAKRAAERAVVEAREGHGLHAVFASLYIHDSPLRHRQFVSRKITSGAAEIAAGRRETLMLGNLDIVRDWGFAGDYVVAMRQMVVADSPADLPIGTGVAHTLADLVETAFDAAEVADPWSRVTFDPSLVRPADAATIVADPEQAYREVGWRASVGFEDVIGHMVEVDRERLRTGVAESVDYLAPAP